MLPWKPLVHLSKEANLAFRSSPPRTKPLPHSSLTTEIVGGLVIDQEDYKDAEVVAMATLDG